MHLARMSLVVALVAMPLAASPAAAQSDVPRIRTAAGGLISDGQPAAHASYRQTTEPVEAVEDDAPAPLPVADGGPPVPATQCYSYLVGVSNGVAQYGRVCPDGSGGWGPVQIVDLMGGPPTTAPGSGSGVVVDAATLARFAMTELALPTPAVRMNPAGEQVVQLPSWLWIDPGQWQLRQTTATAGPVSSTVTADPVRVVWEMGTGDTVTCDGPGRPYAERFAETPEATDCKYTYRRSSAGQPGAAFQVTATIQWAASWAGSDGTSGDLGVVTSSATSSVPVAELQALVQ